jgi:hypothetical protein
MAFQRIYEINTRPWLTDMVLAGRIPATDLTLVPEEYIQQWQRWQVDTIWLMGVWEPSPYSAWVARTSADITLECQRALEGCTLDDCVSSPYAVRGYTVSVLLGGLDGLLHLRQRLRAAGIGLLLDFVPNHTACDHPWITTHPEYYVQGTPEQVAAAPQEFLPVQTVHGLCYIAHGRDPYFPPWLDVAQLNYSHPDLQRAMQTELLRLSQWCDGVRCDMAMLCLSEVFQRTWARLGVPTPSQEFWQETIHTVRAHFPQFCFIAEVYWGLEARLQALGFSLTYDKEWYDALVVRDTARLRGGLQHPRASLARQLRFLENHDEPRAASHYSEAQEEAAAVATLTLPGAVLWYDGQLEGRCIREPVQLRHRQPEPINQRLQAFYERLLTLPDIRQGVFHPLHPRSAWEGNWTWQAFLAWGWAQGTTCWLVVINYADVISQCYLNLAALPLAAEVLHFKDLLHPDIVYERHRSDVQQQGMYFEMPPFGTHLLTIQAGS